MKSYPSLKFWLILSLTVIAGLILILPSPALAQQAAGSGCSLNPLRFSFTKCLASVIHYIVVIPLMATASAVILLATTLIQIMLNLNANILANPLVTDGFRITLALANLGFVLALILIAFGTILRFETYGMKTMLRNLIIAAILVNFSLAIAGLLLDFAGVLTNFFISRAGAGGFSQFDDFVSNLANSLDLQKLVQVKSAGLLGGVAEFGTSVITTFIVTPIVSLIVAVLLLIIFLGIALMFLIRFVYLTVLLIVMPLAWLFWVSPRLTHLWTSWWEKFLRWTFFAPAVTFFIYLAMVGSNQLDQMTQGAGSGAPSSLAADAWLILEAGAVGILAMVVKIGLFAGALVAGNAMGIAGAGMALGAAKGVGNFALRGARAGGGLLGRAAAGRAAGLLTKKGVEPGAQSRLEKMQAWAQKQKVPLLRGAAGLVTRGVAGITAAGTENLVKGAEARVSKMTDQEKLSTLLYADEPTQIAIWNDFAKNQKLDKVDLSEVLTERTKANFIKYGQGKAFGDLEKTAGLDVKTMSLIQAERPQEEIDRSLAEFRATFSDADRRKTQFADIYSDKKAFGLEGLKKGMFQAAFSYATARNDPGGMAVMMPKIKPKDFREFKAIMEGAINKLEGEEKKQAEDALKKNLGRRVLGFEEPPGAPGTPPTTPPPTGGTSSATPT